MSLRSDIKRTFIVLGITTLLQNIILWQAGIFSTVLADGTRGPSTLFWIALLGYLSLLAFGIFQALPAQATPIWLFELRGYFPAAAIPLTVWSALWMRGHYTIALLPLLVGTVRFGRNLYLNRHELQTAPTRQQKWFVVYPMCAYAFVMVGIWITAFLSIIR
ncbi:MAG: hypothetical protein ACPG8W_23070 [Candidatus Promineifilaceae bacterium]